VHSEHQAANQAWRLAAKPEQVTVTVTVMVSVTVTFTVTVTVTVTINLLHNQN
jgi:hypothetical protein